MTAQEFAAKIRAYAEDELVAAGVPAEEARRYMAD